MARRRFFVNAIHAGAAELRGEEARHLARVLRAEPGRMYEISDNQSVWLAEITEAHGDRVVFRPIEPLPAPDPPVRISLCAALIKFDRFEWIVEKATELGVEQIQPVETARSEKGLFEASRKRSERWVRIARESSQQSRRVRVPDILPAQRFASVLAHPAAHRYFLDEAATAPFLRALPSERIPSATVALLIGPEGGWTDSERSAACGAGWQSVCVGPQILRAETATAAAVAILVNAWIS